MKTKPATKPVVGIIMGSDSDWPTLQTAADVCKQFGVPHEARVVSAHRTPTDMANYARKAHRRGLKVIIAGAGGAAHLPGMVASHTPLPVIGVPIETKALKGLDSLLSIAQMPGVCLSRPWRLAMAKTRASWRWKYWQRAMRAC